MPEDAGSGSARGGHWEHRDGRSRWVIDDTPIPQSDSLTHRAPKPPEPDPRELRGAVSRVPGEVARELRELIDSPELRGAGPRRPGDAGSRESRGTGSRRASGSGSREAGWRQPGGGRGDLAVDGGSAGSERRGRRERVADEPPKPPADPVAHAREICLNLLTMRPRTRSELRTHLLKKGVEEQVADQVLGRLNEVGLVDDAAFAEQWVRSRHAYQGMARRALSAELRRKGVADELAAEAVSTLDAESEESRARELVRKRMRAMGSVEETAKIRRLVSMLARKGYSEGMAYRVVRDELRDAGSDGELMDDSFEG